MSALESLTARELIRGLMRGNRAELKLGYSPANAYMAVVGHRPGENREELRGYSEGFSDGMRRMDSMVSEADPPTVENEAYRAGYADGLREDERSSYPSEQAL